MEGPTNNTQLPIVDSWELEQQRMLSNISETLEPVLLLYRAFMMTEETGCIDNAYGLVEDMLATSTFRIPHFEKLLQHLDEVRSGRRHPSLERLMNEMVNVMLDNTTTGHADPLDASEQLRSLYMRRYAQCGGAEDLEQAVRQTEEALAVTPAGHPNRAGLLGALGQLFHDRHKRLGNLKDLEECIRRWEEALEATPIDHPDRAGRLNNLSVKLSDKYDCLGALEDLEEAIRRAQEAVSATSLDHPDRAGM